ncbi:MAG: hypothetical protein AAGA25_03455, partial [Planctomycetota bacterium]
MPPKLDKISRLDIAKQTWKLYHVFDRSSHFSCIVDVTTKISGFSRLLAHTVYNPSISVEIDWERLGPYSKAALVNTVEAGLKFDDDIIQQWFDASDILKLLNAARSWEDMLLAVEAIGG